MTYENIQDTHFFLISKIISKLPNKILFFICKLLGWWITHNNLQKRKKKLLLSNRVFLYFYLFKIFHLFKYLYNRTFIEVGRMYMQQSKT